MYLRYKAVTELSNHCQTYIITYFCMFTEFEHWKDGFERTQNTSYCKSTGVKEKSGLKRTYYYCNRTGKYSAKGKGSRRLKTQGSAKIDGHCTSTLTLTEKADMTECEVDICKTHYGHETQLGHLKISNTEKVLIASKRKAGITKERILQDIRESIGKSSTYCVKKSIM